MFNTWLNKKKKNHMFLSFIWNQTSVTKEQELYKNEVPYRAILLVISLALGDDGGYFECETKEVIIVGWCDFRGVVGALDDEWTGLGGGELNSFWTLVFTSGWCLRICVVMLEVPPPVHLIVALHCLHIATPSSITESDFRFLSPKWRKISAFASLLWTTSKSAMLPSPQCDPKI